MKIRVNPSKEPILKPGKITIVPEYKRAKIIPEQHTIRTIWTKELKHRGKSSQEYSWTYNKKFHPLKPKSRLVVEEYRLEVVVDTVDADPKSASEVSTITPLQ